MPPLLRGLGEFGEVDGWLSVFTSAVPMGMWPAAMRAAVEEQRAQAGQRRRLASHTPAQINL
ncbi:hypothetical protein, partial [Trebonia sp.]|uniref:hypothetical protein n=1 Tax=Trebonia sp. TaxID=2767075 RepID=UPI003BAFD80D